MKETTYKVVFGGVKTGIAATEVRTKLAALYKVQPEQIDALMTHPGHILRKGIPFDIAKQYKQAIESAGGIVRLMPEGLGELGGELSKRAWAAYDAEPRSEAIAQGDAAIIGTVSAAATSAPTLTGAASGRGDIGLHSNMNKFIWLLVFFVTVVIQATNSDFLFALGYSIPWFVAGMVLSPIWWGVTKKGRIAPWQWFDWLNAGAYITVGLLILSVIVKIWVRAQVGG